MAPGRNPTHYVFGSRKANIILTKGVLVLKNAQQPIWDSCAHEPNSLFKKNTNNNQADADNSRKAGRKLRNGELRKAVAKLILHNPCITPGDIMAETGVTKGAVTYAIKKIQESGVPEIDNTVLERALKERSAAVERAKEQRKKEREEEQQCREEERAQRREEIAREIDMQIFLRKQAKRSKRPATISPAGLADWNKMHYDPVTGMLQLLDCKPPADLPRRYPRPQLINMMPDVNRQPEERISANLPAKAQGTAAGRRRIGYMRMF